MPPIALILEYLDAQLLEEHGLEKHLNISTRVARLGIEMSLLKKALRIIYLDL